MWAIEGGHADVVSLLIEHGADVRTPSKGGFTPLMFAARSGDLDSARLLLDAGANVDAGTRDAGPPLAVAAASGHETLAIFLLERGANPNAADKNGITALHNAAQRGLTSLVGTRYDDSYRVQPPNMLQLTKALLARGVNPNARIAANDPRGPDGTPFTMKDATPFFLAAVSGDATLMRPAWRRRRGPASHGRERRHAAHRRGAVGVHRLVRIQGLGRQPRARSRDGASRARGGEGGAGAWRRRECRGPRRQYRPAYGRVQRGNEHREVPGRSRRVR
jgi:ankyrin repeat protein